MPLKGMTWPPLRYEDGDHIKDQKATGRDLKEAYARLLLDKQ